MIRKQTYIWITSNPQLRLLRFNGLGFDQISYADGGN